MEKETPDIGQIWEEIETGIGYLILRSPIKGSSYWVLLKIEEGETTTRHTIPADEFHVKYRRAGSAKK